MSPPDEETLLRRVALGNARSILLARQRAEQELLATKEALEDETRILEILNRTGAKLASKLDQDKLIQAVTDAATEVSGADFGAFFYTATDPEGEVFQLFALSGAPREAFDGFGHPRSTPVFGPTYRGERVVRSDDITREPEYGQLPPHHGMPENHLPVRSYLAVPVVSRGGTVLGGLLFGHSEAGVFTERTERIVVGIAAQAAIAIDNARLYEEARRSAEERSRLLEGEREARAEVERVSLMKDEFLATLSHELRTPLNAVLGWAEVLIEGFEAGSTNRRGLETIARNARAQAQLIDDLLDMNRIVSGKIRLDVQRVDLASIVEGAIEAVRPSAEAKSIRLSKILDPKAFPIFGDPNRMQQIVWNLLSNAVKFTPKDGKIDVRLVRVGSQVEITVADSGIGISSEFLPQLFQRFRQADSSTTRRHGGLGLGLSIVKQLVELHGGQVRAESTGLERGATFTVVLPVRPLTREEAREHPAAPGARPATPPELDLAGVRVLIVDDEPDARDIVKFVLGEAKATVITASTADEALALVRAERPHVVVSDIGMPDKDGYELIRELRDLPPSEGGDVPAIALTAFARSEDRTRAMLAGYQVHVAKPIEPRELVVTVGSLAGRTGRRTDGERTE